MIDWHGLPIYLGSKSPRRKALLQQIGLQFKVIPSDFDEDQCNHIVNPADQALKIAIEKGKALLNKINRGWIITADTIVVIDNIILGKPSSREEAASMLRKLSNRTHTVYTGLAITNSGNSKFTADVEATKVTFKALSEDEIFFYIDNYSPFDKAGSYGIQDYSAVFCSSIKGCFYNVVGFPLYLFYRMATSRLDSLI